MQKHAENNIDHILRIANTMSWSSAAEMLPFAQHFPPTKMAPASLILEAAPYEDRGGNSHYTGRRFPLRL